jgi:hypothetical protein
VFADRTWELTRMLRRVTALGSHTFVATVDGQASVVKGDSMVLLDDSNSYWWLVNVLKADEVGYIPAENIETPNDRLARLNKMRNVEVRPQAGFSHASLVEQRC